MLSHSDKVTHWLSGGLPRYGKAFEPNDQVEVLEDEVRPCCPICTSEDTVNFGAHELDDGSDRWGCGLCGGEFLVVIR